MSERTAKSKFYWASVAHADPEVVEVTIKDGKRVAYTCGCEDPFYPDEPNCQLVLGSHVDKLVGGKVFKLFDPQNPKPIERPKLEKRSFRAMKAADTVWANSGPHRWRGPR